MSENVKYTKDVVIAGKTLTLSTEVSEEHLERVYEAVSDRFDKIAKSNRIASQLTIGLVLGVELCDEYFIEIDKLNSKVVYLENKIRTMQSEDEKKNFEVLEDVKKAHEIELGNIKKELDNKKKEFEQKLKEYDEVLATKELEIKNVKRDINSLISRSEEELKRNKDIYEDIIKEKDEELFEQRNELDKIIKEKDIEIKRLNEINNNENEMKESLEKISDEQERAIEKLKQEYETKLNEIYEAIDKTNNVSNDDENSNLREENTILRKRLEEMMLIQKENFEEYNADFDDFEEIEEFFEIEETAQVEEKETVIEPIVKNSHTSSSSHKNKKKRKGRK